MMAENELNTSRANPFTTNENIENTVATASSTNMSGNGRHVEQIAGCVNIL